MVQVVVTQIREILTNFNIAKGNISNVSQLNIRDADFESALKTLESAVESLYQNVLQSSNDDKALFEFFKLLLEKFKQFNESFSDLQAMILKSEGAATTSLIRTKEAEDIIELIKRLLSEIEYKLINEISQITSQNLSGNNQNDTAKILKEIAEEVLLSI